VHDPSLTDGRRTEITGYPEGRADRPPTP